MGPFSSRMRSLMGVHSCGVKHTHLGNAHLKESQGALQLQGAQLDEGALLGHDLMLTLQMLAKAILTWRAARGPFSSRARSLMRVYS